MDSDDESQITITESGSGSQYDDDQYDGQYSAQYSGQYEAQYRNQYDAQYEYESQSQYESQYESQTQYDDSTSATSDFSFEPSEEGCTCLLHSEDLTDQLGISNTGHEACYRKLVGLFFGASWCEPSNVFCQKLAEVSMVYKDKMDKLQIIYMPCDESEEEAEDTFQNMPDSWLQFSFKHPMISKLQTKYKVKTVPRLIIITPAGDLVSARGRVDVEVKGMGALSAWLDTAKKL